MHVLEGLFYCNNRAATSEDEVSAADYSDDALYSDSSEITSAQKSKYDDGMDSSQPMSVSPSQRNRASWSQSTPETMDFAPAESTGCEKGSVARARASFCSSSSAMSLQRSVTHCANHEY